MLVELKRIFNCSTYCISHIYVDGSYVCDAIEDTDRMLDQKMTVEEIMKKKIYAHTAIPTGRYKITLDVVSPKYSKTKYYMDFCKGKLPRILDVKGFAGILMHKGNTAKDSAGCIILGYNTIKGMVTSSKQAFEALYHKLDCARRIGQTIYIEISRIYSN